MDKVMRARAYNSVGQAIGAGGFTTLVLNTTFYESHPGMHTGGAGVAAVHEGLWTADASMLWNSFGVAAIVAIRLSATTAATGTIIMAESVESVAAGVFQSFNLSASMQMKFADFWSMAVFTTIAGSVSGATATSQYACGLGIHSASPYMEAKDVP